MEAPKGISCEEPIRDLLNLRIIRGDTKDVKEKKLKAREALKVWKEWKQEVEEDQAQLTTRKDGLIGEIYQLLALYSVFVSIVFSAVQGDRVQCQHVWSPIVLCLLPCFIILYHINNKLEDIKNITEDINLNKSTLRVHKQNLATLKAKGYLRFNFKEDGARPNLSTPAGHNNTGVTRLGVILTFLLSSAVTVGSILHILCFTKSHNRDGSENWTDYTPTQILPC